MYKIKFQISMRVVAYLVGIAIYLYLSVCVYVCLITHPTYVTI